MEKKAYITPLFYAKTIKCSILTLSKQDNNVYKVDDSAAVPEIPTSGDQNSVPEEAKQGFLEFGFNGEF